MNRKKLTDAEAQMMEVEKLRRRMMHAPSELRGRMEEEMDKLHGQARKAVLEAAEAEEDEG